MLRKTATLLAFVSLCGVAVYSMFLVFIGQPLGYMDAETQIRWTQYEPNPVALIPLACAVVITIGVLWRNRKLQWTGIFVLTLFSMLFLFGIGGPLIPSSFTILLLLTILEIFKLKN